MSTAPNRPERKGTSTKTLIPFFAIAFGLGWGIIALLILFPQQIQSLIGPMGYTNPLFILAVYSPAIAGITLVWRHFGLKGLAGFFRRITFWRMPITWWLFLLAGIPAVFFLGAAIKGTIPGQFPFSPWYKLLPALAVGLVIGPIEEFGWRGVALPLLQRRFVPFWASLILGVIWGVWHLPAFFLSGSPQSAWPDAQPWDSFIFAGVAVIVVLIHRRGMFARERAATDVLPGREG
jgi:membrane protease YdiL (CAAX protease family)